jgi:hypothetical protein
MTRVATLIGKIGKLGPICPLHNAITVRLPGEVASLAAPRWIPAARRVGSHLSTDSLNRNECRVLGPVYALNKYA